MFRNAKIINALTGWGVIFPIALTALVTGIVLLQKWTQIPPQLQIPLLAIWYSLIGIVVILSLVTCNVKGYCQYQNAIDALKKSPMMVIIVCYKVNVPSDFISLTTTVLKMLSKHNITPIVLANGDIFVIVKSFADVRNTINANLCKCALVISANVLDKRSQIYSPISFALVGRTDDSLWKTEKYGLVPYYCYTRHTSANISATSRFIVETTLERLNIHSQPQSSGVVPWFKRPSISLMGFVDENCDPGHITLKVREESYGGYIGGDIVSYCWDDGDGNVKTTDNNKMRLSFPFKKGAEPTATVTTAAGASTTVSIKEILTQKKVNPSKAEVPSDTSAPSNDSHQEKETSGEKT